MSRAVLFLSRFVISLWVVLVVAFVSLLLFNAPSVPNTTPFASVSIKTKNNPTIHLPNRIFTCTETGQQFQCQATIQDRLLDLSLTKGSDYKYYFSNCRASYDSKSVGCQKVGQTYAPILSETYEITDLELNPQQLRAVEQEHWGINIIMQLGELRLHWISTGLSLAAGIGAAFLAYLHPGKFSKAFASFACGFGMNHLVWSFLGRVPFDVVTPYGLTPDTWVWVVNGTAIAAGIGTTLATALLLWRRFNRFTRILISISSSVGVFGLCMIALLWVLSYLPSFFGLTETLLPFLQDGSVLMWISVAISSIFAIAAAILLWLHTNQSIKRFLCLGSGVGAVALASNFFLVILLGLGYAD